MQDAPELIWIDSLGSMDTYDDGSGVICYTRTDLCITEAECQRRIDAAVLAEREACECEVRRQFRIWEDFGASGFDDLCMAIIPDAIRARGQK